MTGKPRHIVMTVNASWNVLNFRLPLLRALLARGDRVTVLAPPDDAVAALIGEGARHVPLKMDTKGLNPLRDGALVGRLARHFRAQAPDVVLSWTIKNNLFGAFAARRVGVPFIPNVTGLGTAFLSGGLLQRVAETLYRAAFPRLDTVFFQNEDDRALFVGRKLVRAGQARLLPGSGIDLARFAPAPLPDGGPDAGPAFLMIARLLRDKGVVEYAQAARLVRARHPGAQFRLLGALGAENRSAIDAATLAGWQAAGDVVYLGQTDDVRPAIAAADVVVLPSYREGAPRTLIEAAAMARPLIATDVPGCRAVVGDGVSGYLCAVRDAASLAEACLRMIALAPAARAAMGQAGRRKMEAEFDERIVVAAYLDAIARVTGGA
ncbi:MAG: glycosyltransferase family 4 protein [Rhodobacterales bacterium]|nr:glycosyltransferase family 4 protein [Rhodobacterales bacterium]